MSNRIKSASESKPQTLTPKLRFPEFRDAGDWGDNRLGEIVDVLQGFGFPEKYQGKTDGQYPFYKVSDISNALASGNHFIEKSANYVDDGDLAGLRAKTIPSGTTIFAKIGEAIRSNRRAITTIECVIDNNTAGVKSKKGKADDLFVFYLFSKISLIEHAGGVVPSVNKTTMESIPILAPEIPEQQKVADCLTSIDDLITAEAQKLEHLKAHKKGLMQQMFPAEGKTVPKLRFPEFRDSGAWEETRLGEILHVEMGQSPESHSYNQNHIGLPLIQGNADISNRLSSPKRYTSEPTKICNVGDVLLSVRAPIGEVSISQHYACIGRGVAALRLQKKSNSVLDFWFQFLLKHEQNWQKLGQGSTFSAISGPNIRNLNILLPRPKEQQKIADCLTSLDELIAAQTQKIAVLKTHKKGLMQQLFPPAEEMGG